MENVAEPAMPGWQPVSREDQELIERIVAEAAAALRLAGAETRDPRFPFVMHHDRYRSSLGGRRKLRHGEVAALLNRWAAIRPGFAERYAWQAVRGAAEHLAAASRQPGLADVLKPAAAWSDGPGFSEWSKSLQSAGAAARDTER